MIEITARGRTAREQMVALVSKNSPLANKQDATLDAIVELLREPHT